jgi:four helix bundle protein
MEGNRFEFENLILWQKACEFKIEIRQLTEKFPNEEKYRLTDQLIRSSRSVNALIAEGHGRFILTLIKFITACRQEVHLVKKSITLSTHMMRSI